MQENNDQDILQDSTVNLVPANVAKRLVNYVIDVIVFSFVLSFLLPVLAPIYPLANKIIQAKGDTTKLMGQFGLMDQLMISFLYGLYMSVLEAVLKGKSVGKYLTGSRAVTLGGKPVAGQTAFVRGLIRIVPFEQFSIIFNFPRLWHDSWSQTVVVDENKSVLPNK